MSLGSFFGGLFSHKDTSVVGVDIGSSAIKMVQIRKKKGRAILETYGELALGPYAGIEIGRATSLPMEKVVQALRDIIREARIKSNKAGIAIPLSSSLVTFISVPAIQGKQLGDMVTLEARKYIPVPINEVLLDWSVVPSDRVNSLPEDPNTLSSENSETDKRQLIDVLLAAIHIDALNSYRSISTGAGLEPSFFEIEIFSSIRSVIEHGLEPHMIVDMGSKTTKLYIIERGMLKSSHIINRGSQDITIAISKSLGVSVAEAENLKRIYGLEGGIEHKDLTEIISLTLDYIFYESNRTIFEYERKHNKAIKKVILTGGGVLLRGFSTIAQKSFENEVVYANPFSKLETPAFLGEQLSLAGPEFAVAIGVALRRLSEIN